MTLANDPNSSKVSKDKENSPEEADMAEANTPVETPAEVTESDDIQREDSADELAPGAEVEADIGNAELILDEDDAEVTGEDTEPEVTDDEVVEPEPVRQETTASTSPPPSSGPSTFGMVFGGLIAGAIGFLVATFAIPERLPNPPANPNTEMLATLSAQAERIDALAGQIESIQPAPEVVEIDLTPVTSELSDLALQIDALSGRVSEASERLAALEDRPVAIVEPVPDVDFDAEMSAFRSELAEATAAAQAEVEAAQARAAKVEADALVAAETAMQRAALAEVSAALESGSPFADALKLLPAAPDALTATAEQGVPTMAVLRAEFPDAARTALRNVQSVPGETSATDRFAAFLRQQTNARSLSPRDGDAPDAVLSRAEAALNDGDVSAALAELSALPEGASASLSEWISKAETRVSAMSAASSLVNELN